MTGSFVNPSWMPHSISEAAKAGDASADDLLSGRAWSHLLDALGRAAEVVRTNSVARNPDDLAAGFRHLLVLLSLGADQALRAESDPVLAVSPSGRRQRLQVGHGLPRLHLHGCAAPRRRDLPHLGQPRHARATSGCSRWPAWPPRPTSSSTNSTSARAARWSSPSRPSATTATGCPSPRTPPSSWCATSSTTGTPRWRRRCRSSGWAAVGVAVGDPGAARPPADPREATARQLIALGDFVLANLEFFLQFSRPETPNTFLPPLDGTAMGAAAENRPVIGSFQLEPGRGVGRRGDAADGPVLELLGGKPVVGDDRLRPAPEQPQRAPGGASMTTACFVSSSRTRTPASPTGSTRPGTAPGR